MEFHPLHPDFGVLVTGFDLVHGGTQAEIAALREAYDRHAMLLFRGGGRLAPERHLEIASWFGPPPPVSNGGEGDFVSVLDNADWAGSARLPFHCDLTYTDAPIAAICLHAIALPRGETSTSFVSNGAAWQRLPGDMQEELADKTLRHVLVSTVPGYDWPDFVADHPLRLIHPRTGQPLLLATEHHAARILELDEAGSRAMLDRLFAELYAPERIYLHRWQIDDLLLWDNLALQHARTEEADPGQGRRALQRVALSEVGLAELVERARVRAGA